MLLPKKKETLAAQEKIWMGRWLLLIIKYIIDTINHVKGWLIYLNKISWLHSHVKDWVMF
jgi:hypothetical protein